MTEPYPILEFDSDRGAILNPDAFKANLSGPVPNVGVLCFFYEVLNEMAKNGELKPMLELNSEIGPNPVYTYEVDGRAITVCHPGVGAPLAAAFMEELIAIGVTKFVVCGGCGVLNREIAAGHPVILTSAVRDEGTSYHYIPPSREVEPRGKVTRALIDTFTETGLDFRVGKAWTTDAIYRETKGKRKARLEEGCEVVEMEAAALFAVAQFREVSIGQVVYGGDLVVPEGWDGRSWEKRGDDRRLLFDLSVKAARKLF